MNLKCVIREYDQKTATEAEQLLVDDPSLDAKKSIILYQPHWHKGVIGIVASRIAEKYHKPTIILTQSDDDIVGSARSVSQFDIHNVIESCSDMLINYGGHKYAAGMTLSQDKIQEFEHRFEEKVATAIMPAQEQPEIEIAAIVNLSNINYSLWDQLSRFAPFGPGNKQPIFICEGVRDSGHTKQMNGKHLRLALKQDSSRVIYAVAYNKAELLDRVKKSKAFDISFSLQKN